MTASAPAGVAPSATLDREQPDAVYIGLFTRAIAFALDAAVINVVAVVVGVGTSLILSLLHLPTSLKAALIAAGGAVYILWTIGYFVTFWSTTGQTPGARVMQIRVGLDGDGKVGPKRALVRWVGILLAALPLFLGYLPILFDRKRRGLQDRMAHTVVVEAPQLSFAAMLKSDKLAAREAARHAVPPK